jgi:hypothetical protein
MLTGNMAFYQPLTYTWFIVYNCERICLLLRMQAAIVMYLFFPLSLHIDGHVHMIISIKLTQYAGS